MKVLIIEDDPQMGNLLRRVMADEGFETEWRSTGEDGIQQANKNPPDVLVLDWMLPDIDGITVCQRLRAVPCTFPILMLTARGELTDRVHGLNCGADDYLVKPFEIDELLARLRALARRTTAPSTFRLGELTVDALARRVLCGQTAVELTQREFALLQQLAQAGVGTVVSSESLLRIACGLSIDPGTNLVHVSMSRLRDKLGDLAWMIETVRGAGYRIRTERP